MDFGQNTLYKSEIVDQITAGNVGLSILALFLVILAFLGHLTRAQLIQNLRRSMGYVKKRCSIKSCRGRTDAPRYYSYYSKLFLSNPSNETKI